MPQSHATNHVPVGVGSDGGSSTHVDNFSESSGTYIPPSIDPATSGTSSVIHPDGQQLLLPFPPPLVSHRAS